MAMRSFLVASCCVALGLGCKGDKPANKTEPSAASGSAVGSAAGSGSAVAMCEDPNCDGLPPQQLLDGTMKKPQGPCLAACNARNEAEVAKMKAEAEAKNADTLVGQEDCPKLCAERCPKIPCPK
jgi:hypothetical protein